MASQPVLRGKEKVLKHFQNTKHCYWKLYNALDTKSPLQTFLTSNKISDAQIALTEILDVLEPNGVYILDTFAPGDTKQKDYIRPETSITFSLSDAQQQQPAISGNGKAENIYTPAFGDHIDLIKQNAKLTAELDYTKKQFSDVCLEVERLRNELNVANSLLDEYEEEEQEEEPGVTGTKETPKDVETAIAALITEKGGEVIQHFFGKKEELKPVVEISEESNQAINGMQLPHELPPLPAIVNELKKHDVNLHQHFFKLLAIAQQQPATFKALINQIDSF